MFERQEGHSPNGIKSLFISTCRMPFLALTLDTSDPLLIALVIAPGFYLHQVQVTDQDPTSVSL